MKLFQSSIFAITAMQIAPGIENREHVKSKKVPLPFFPYRKEGERQLFLLH
jgi:hypothetical protein